MAYWRMQLHPSDSPSAMRYAVESLGAGFVGLDFEEDLGDIRRLDPAKVAETQRDYLNFANQMALGDRVLIIVHHFPFALVTIAGDYNYIARPEPELGVWFRHLRRINKAQTRYFADRVTNAAKWEQYKMTDTIAPLKTVSGQSYQLIESWVKDS